MATYKRRGYKPKTKEEKKENEIENSTTAEVFSSLDEGAYKVESWVQKKQKGIIGVISALVIIGVSTFLYQNYIVYPKQKEASAEFFFAEQNFIKANESETKGNTQETDSLYNIALNGDGSRYGLLDIISNYSGTEPANVANYAAGISYLKTKQYQQAISYLENFSTDDIILGPLAIGAIGDAYSEMEQLEKALEYYKKGIAKHTNEYTTPLLLKKAGIIALQLENTQMAKTFFQRIRDEFSSSEESQSVETILAKIQR